MIRKVRGRGKVIWKRKERGQVRGREGQGREGGAGKETEVLTWFLPDWAPEGTLKWPKVKEVRTDGKEMKH